MKTGENPGLLQLCGSVRLETDDGAVLIPRGQRRVVFGYLALNRDRAVSRAELVEALWPGETAPSHPEAVLSSVLSRLRRLVAVSGRSELRLAVAPEVRCDIDVARDDLEAARQAAEAGALEDTVRLARRAAETVAAGLLPGTEGLWLDEHRAAVDDLWVDAMEVLAHAALGLGGRWCLVAQQASKRIIGRSPYRESAHVLLMQALAARGNEAEALRAFDTLRCRLAADLGVVPGAAARDLHALLVRSSGDVPELSVADLPPRLQRAREHGGLVGRAAELAALDARIARGDSVIVLDGEPGIGKTRLVAEAALHAVRRGERVWHARCREPVEEILATRGQREALAPVIAAARTDQGRRLVIVEDVQWATAATQATLAALVGEVPAGSCILLTTRDALASQPVLAAHVAELHCERALHRVTLTGLGHAAVAELARERAGALLTSDAVARLHERTAGNPLLLCDLIDEHGRDLARDPAAAEPSTGLSEVLRTRVGRVGGRLLAAAAVMGTSFSFAAVETLGGGTTGGAMEIIEAAMREGYLEEDQAGPDRFRFRHPLIRETLARSVSGPRRVLWAQGALGGRTDDDGRLSIVRLAPAARAAAPGTDLQRLPPRGERLRRA